jgi:hypothetical protein
MKSCTDDSLLSIYMEILILSSFMSIKYTIKPIEDQIKHFINKQDDIFQHQDKIYNLLQRYNLIPTKAAIQVTLNHKFSLNILMFFYFRKSF